MNEPLPPIRWVTSTTVRASDPSKPTTRLQYLDENGVYRDVPLVQIQEPPYTGEEVPSDE